MASSTEATKISDPRPDLASERATLGPSLHRYFRRITIEGLDTYLRAHGTFEKRVWLLVILAGMAGTLVYLIPAFSRYLQYTTVLDIGYKTDSDLQLPNTWICRVAMNYTYFYDRFSEARSRLRRDKRMQLFAERFTRIWRSVYDYQGADLSIDWVFNITLSYITLMPLADGLSWLRNVQPQLLNEVLYRGIELLGSEWPGIGSFYEKGFFDCPSVMKKCSLNGISIDCCRDSAAGFNILDQKCYQIDVHRELRNNPSLVQRGQPIELSIETFADSKYYPWDVTEAPCVTVSFQKHWPTLLDEVHNIAAGTTNKFSVKGTRKRKIFDCIDRYRYNEKLHVNADPLIQQYFKNMQTPEVYTMELCTNARLVEAMSIRCGCVPYFDTLRPNETIICTPAHIYACYYGALQDTTEMEAIEKDAGGIQQKDIFVDLKDLIASECAQLCDSWRYDVDVFSTIMDGEEGNISTYWRNKITVTFDPEYRVETEMLKMDYHAFLASIGDGLGLILGMSFITLIQLTVWSVAALCFRRRLRRVGYVIEDDDDNEASV